MKRVCKNCYGRGYVNCSRCAGTGKFDNGTTCNVCHGSGQEKCRACNGKGEIDD